MNDIPKYASLKKRIDRVIKIEYSLLYVPIQKQML